MALNNKACGPRLRGLRYHIRENQWVYNRIRDLRFLDFEETIGFYIEFQERYGIDNELRACDPETEYERRKRLKAQALLACNDRYYLLTGLLLRQSWNARPRKFDRSQSTLPPFDLRAMAS